MPPLADVASRSARQDGGKQVAKGLNHVQVVNGVANQSPFAWAWLSLALLAARRNPP